MMNPNILNKNPLMFFDRAVNAQRSQLLTVMADAVSECRTAADQAAELNETGQVGLLRLAEVWSAIRAKEGMGGLVLEGTEAKILSDVVAQFYAYLSGCMFNDPVGMAIYWSFCHIHSPSYILLFPFPVGYVYTVPTINQNNSYPNKDLLHIGIIWHEKSASVLNKTPALLIHFYLFISFNDIIHFSIASTRTNC